MAAADEHRYVDARTVHELREAAALIEGWSGLLFHHWDTLDERTRWEMVVGALHGAKRLSFVLDVVDGHHDGQVKLPHERMADEFISLVEEG